jgi:hypothetical protein
VTPRKPFEFPKNKSELASEEVPEFMKDDVGMVTENIGPDDVLWMVPDAEGRLKVPLPKLGDEQHSPFDLVLLAIIRAHRKNGTGELPEGKRLKRARTALFGKPKRRAGLSRTVDEILLKVGRQVFEDIVADKGREVELAPLIRKFAAPHYKPEELDRTEETETPTVRRLISQFEKRRDEYLARVTTPDYYDFARIFSIIDQILDRLESLDVRVARQTWEYMSRANFKAK